MRRFSSIAVAVGLLALTLDALAQAYPTRPLRLIVPFPPGGGNDIVGRIVAAKLGEGLGQQVVVDNRGGAGGTIGTDITAKAPPDGYTLLVNNISLAVNQTLFEKLPYDTLKDLAHVPYKGLGPALLDLMGGRLHIIISTMASALPQLKAGKLRALAVTTASRSSFFPEIPTMDEAGVKGYEFSTWYGLIVPARTPKAVIDRLNEETRKALVSAAVKEQFTAQGLEPSPSTPQEFGVYLKSEVTKWGKVVKASGATPQ